MKKIRVGIVGATGYTGEELLRILSHHPDVEIIKATSQSLAGKKISAIFPDLKIDLAFEPLQDDPISRNGLFVFSCLPHKEAMSHIPLWIKNGLKVVDLSADFRFNDVSIYEKWYQKHSTPDLLKKSVYGLPEFHREEIRNASLVGNPGCYPTGALLGILPLLKEGIVSPDGIVIDSKSGMSGAGRKTVEEKLKFEANESVHAYNIGKHRHTPEIEQELSLAAKKPVSVVFTPHLIPMHRGILSTIYLKPTSKTDTQKILKAFQSYYQNEPFVKVLPEGYFPKTKEVTGTNACHIGALHHSPTGQIIVVTAIDNLIKGASGQAVQNMNLMCGLEETIGLT